jgi:hypothetical protein
MIDFLSGLTRIVSAARFNINSKGTVTCSTNDVGSIRAFLFTDAMTSDEPTVFCLGTVSKLLAALKLLKTIQDEDSIDLKLNDIFLEYNGNNGFKFATVDYASIQSLTSNPIKKRPENVFTFKTPTPLFKKLLQTNRIVNRSADDGGRLYIYCRDGRIVGELGDRSNSYSDSISMELTDTVERGNLDRPLCLKYTNALYFTTFASDYIEFNLTACNKANITSTKRAEADGKKYLIMLDMYTTFMSR